MLIIMHSGCTPDEVERVRGVLGGAGCRVREIPLDSRLALIADERADGLDSGLLESLPGVQWIGPGSSAMRHVTRAMHPANTVIRVGSLTIGDGEPTLIAGPCAVEKSTDLVALSVELRKAGAMALRGGAYKPRTSPHDFQGLEEEGLRRLADARRESGLPVITEAVDEASMDLVEAHADIVQIGARNMQNFALLKRAGRSSLPVFLKRGFSATLDDFLLSAEYVLAGGNENVMLCERGIRTFSNHSRFTLDLGIVPRLKKLTHLPVFVDPSHASGIRESVAPLARAAIAAGADGVMVEVHPAPEHALCDGRQSLSPEAFAELATELKSLSRLLSRPGAAVR